MARKRLAVIQSRTVLYEPETGSRPIGGAERYIRDLGHLLREMGFSVRYIQPAPRDYRDSLDGWAEVYGVAAPRRAWGDLIYARRAYELTESADLVCYGNLEAGFPYLRGNSFAIQHGVWWDYPINTFKRLIQNTRVRSVIRATRFVICVDTNFINWYRTAFPAERGIRKKLYYIPNYADTNVFFPTHRNRRQERRPILLFPRRFEHKRGYALFIDMCKHLARMGYEFEVELVGTGRDAAEVERLAMSQLGSRVRVYSTDFETIATRYREAFLVFVPTLWSEGTSLAAIEAIVSGCPVIATDVGGLPNIVIPGFNGMICPPDAVQMAETTARLIRQPELRDRMAANCLAMRDALSKQRWVESVEALILRHFRELY